MWDCSGVHKILAKSCVERHAPLVKLQQAYSEGQQIWKYSSELSYTASRHLTANTVSWDVVIYRDGLAAILDPQQLNTVENKTNLLSYQFYWQNSSQNNTYNLKLILQQLWQAIHPRLTNNMKVTKNRSQY